MYNDMQIQIHHLEQEAYCAVLRAFKAQADAITWEKESLITELRKELRVSDDEHRDLLSRVNADDVIKRIREWRQSIGHQAAMPNPSHTMSNAQRMQSGPLHFHSMNASVAPSSLNQGSGPARGRKRPKANISSGPVGTSHVMNQSSAANRHTATALSNPLIGRRVMTRWPDDNNFYEAVIIDYDPIQRRHALAYDKDTPNETSEWVALAEIPPADIRWVGEDPSELVAGGVSLQGHAEGGEVTGQSVQFPPNQIGSGNKLPEDIEIFDTDTLIKEVERVFNSSNPDPAEVELAKKMLREQEQALVDAIAVLATITEGDSGNI
ncbi:hypothetical protein QQ045_004306 [Rhodiola kirilowii]